MAATKTERAVSRLLEGEAKVMRCGGAASKHGDGCCGWWWVSQSEMEMG